MEWHKRAKCHCGSGKRYVDCCLQTDRAMAFENPIQAWNRELDELLGSRAFDSPLARQDFIVAFRDAKNAEPRPEYLGLSADQVHLMVNFPLQGTDDMVVLNESLGPDDLASAPVARDAAVFLKAMAEAGPVKATVRGNLGREFAKCLFDEIDRSPWKRYVRFRSEEDSTPVQSLRLTLTYGGWIRKAKGSFRLTRRGERSVADGFSGADFLRLLRTFAGTFNWAFMDRYAELEIIQRTFMFSLFLIHRKARDFVEDNSLTPFFIRAFPQVLVERPMTFGDPFRGVNAGYVHRFLERFCEDFGLIEKRPISKDPILGHFRFRASPFFDKLLTWKVWRQIRKIALCP